MCSTGPCQSAAAPVFLFFQAGLCLMQDVPRPGLLEHQKACLHLQSHAFDFPLFPPNSSLFVSPMVSVFGCPGLSHPHPSPAFPVGHGALPWHLARHLSTSGMTLLSLRPSLEGPPFVNASLLPGLCPPCPSHSQQSASPLTRGPPPSSEQASPQRPHTGNITYLLTVC